MNRKWQHTIGLTLVLGAAGLGYLAGNRVAYMRAFPPNLFAASLNHQLERIEKLLNVLENQHQGKTANNREQAAASLVLTMDTLLRDPAAWQHPKLTRQVQQLLAAGLLTPGEKAIHKAPELAPAYQRLQATLANMPEEHSG